MFGHDDDKQPQNLPEPAPDDNLGAVSDPLTTVASGIDDTAGDYVATPVAGSMTAPTTAPAVSSPVAPVLSDTSAVAPAVAAGDDLLSLKQQALQQLTPLMEHLEQTPEEKFRTTMMMIQASDNQVLLKAAYEAALAIPDEKVRAQALLDVVNEINYFTQNSSTESAAETPAA